jgi:flagella basal body P-ring formation protein FlgA
MGGDPELYVTDAGQAIGRELNRRLSSGELIRRSHLAPPKCAKRGEIVRVRCEVSGMTISMNAQALDDGRLGDTVRLRNPTSDATFRAVLNGRKSALFLTQ